MQEIFVEIEDAVVGAVASVAQERLVGDLVIFEFAVGQWLVGVVAVGRMILDGAVVEFELGHAARRNLKMHALVVAVKGEVAKAVGEGVETYIPVFVPAADNGPFDGLPELSY